MERLAVVAIGDVDALVAGNGMRIYCKSRGYTVLPFFLHFCVHHEKRVMGQMDGDLAFGIRTRILIFRDDLANTEFPGNSEADATDDGARTEIGQLVRMVADALLSPSIAVDKGCVWLPFFWRLVSQLLTFGVAGADSGCDFAVDGVLNAVGDGSHNR